MAALRQFFTYYLMLWSASYKRFLAVRSGRQPRVSFSATCSLKTVFRAYHPVNGNSRVFALQSIYKPTYFLHMKNNTLSLVTYNTFPGSRLDRHSNRRPSHRKISRSRDLRGVAPNLLHFTMNPLAGGATASLLFDNEAIHVSTNGEITYPWTGTNRLANTLGTHFRYIRLSKMRQFRQRVCYSKKRKALKNTKVMTSAPPATNTPDANPLHSNDGETLGEPRSDLNNLNAQLGEVLNQNSQSNRSTGDSHLAASNSNSAPAFSSRPERIYEYMPGPELDVGRCVRSPHYDHLLRKVIRQELLFRQKRASGS